MKSSSSSATRQKNSQSRQFLNFSAMVPETSPPHIVPAMVQQQRPPFVPPLIPSTLESVDAGQTPSSQASFPPGCRSQPWNSQQLIFGFFRIPR